jgi:HTH-type transcriptional regulator/antitoxin HigA
VNDPQLQLFERDSPPPPPGDLIRAELERRGWGQEDLARILGRPLATVNKIIQGLKQITPETAVELGSAFKTTPDFWMAQEAAYRLSRVHSDSQEKETVEKRANIYSKVPLTEMIKRKWILSPEVAEKAEQVICRFLEIPTINDTPKLLANARSSTAGYGFSPEQAAWCYRALHISKMIKASQFRRSKIAELRAHLRNLSNLAKNVQHIPKLMAEYGIRFVVVQHLTGTKIDGAAFWLNEQSPVIALSLRYDRVNHFWHTLSHEIAHIDHHDAHLDSDSFETIRDDEPESEKRANSEAAQTFIDSDELLSFIRRTSPFYTTKKIIQFANRMSVHPSIVVGQLQFRQELDWSQGAQLHTKCRDYLTEVALTDGWGRYLPPFDKPHEPSN